MILKLIRKVKENKEVAVVSALVVSNLILTGLVAINMSLKTHFIAPSKYTSIEPVKEHFCTQAFQSIIDRKLHPHMMSKSIKKALIQSQYAVLELSLGDELKYVFSTEKGCKVIIKDKIGLRQFDLNLDKGENYPFYFLISEIHEEDIKEEV